MQLIFDHKTAETDDIFSFYFKSENLLNYTPGQFIELKLPHKNPDSRGSTRWFTLSSSPLDKKLSITTKISENGSSYKKTLFNLIPGTVVDITGPMGDFVLPKILQTPIVFIAGGIGVTPIISMIKYLLQTHEIRPLHLFYTVNNESDIIFNNFFEKYKLPTTIVVNQPTEAWGGEQGQLNTDMIIDIIQPTNNTLFYLSGPDSMVKSLSKSLKEIIDDQKRIITDFFPGYN